MDNIIFDKIINKVNDATVNINSYFNNIDYFNTNIYDIIEKIPKYNVVIYIFIIFLIYNFISRLNIRLNEILSFLICIILIYYLIKKNYSQFIKYTEVKQNQLNFLHDLIFENKDYEYASVNNLLVKPVGKDKKSYLYLNPAIVDFFYNLRNYSSLNISAYVNSVIHCNNVIGLDYQSKIGIDRKYSNNQLAIEESDKALNSLNCDIYNLHSTINSYNKFDKSRIILQGLLNKHIEDMGTLFKNENKTQEINIGMMPDNFYDEYFKIKANDINTPEYIPIYNIY